MSSGARVAEERLERSARVASAALRDGHPLGQQEVMGRPGSEVEGVSEVTQRDPSLPVCGEGVVLRQLAKRNVNELPYRRRAVLAALARERIDALQEIVIQGGADAHGSFPSAEPLTQVPAGWLGALVQDRTLPVQPPGNAEATRQEASVPSTARIMMRWKDAMMRRVRTTVNIDEALLRKARGISAQTRQPLGDIIGDALRLMFEREAASEHGRVELPTDGGSGLRPGVDLEDKESLADLLGDNRLPSAPR